MIIWEKSDIKDGMNDRDEGKTHSCAVIATQL